MKEQMRTKTAQLFPVLRPFPQRRPAAPPSPPPLLRFQRLAARISSSLIFFISLDVPQIHFPLIQVVKSGSTETRVEKRIVISADADEEKVQN